CSCPRRRGDAPWRRAQPWPPWRPSRRSRGDGQPSDLAPFVVVGLVRAGDEGLESGLGEDHVVRDENVVRVQLARLQDVDLGQVAGGQPRGLVGAVDDQEQVLALADLAEQALGGLRGGGLALDHAGDDVDAVVAGPVGEGVAQGRGLHLLRGPLRVVARLRAVDDATAGELRSAGRALTGTAGALLAVRLAATAADLAARLRLVRALTGSGQLCDDDLVDQRNADLLDVEDLRGELDGTGLVARRRKDVNSAHRLPQAPLAAVRTRTRPPFGPGTAPLMSSRPFSASTAWTVRFWVVTRSLPIRPAMRWPLNTRPGVAQPPMEPGARCLRCVP